MSWGCEPVSVVASSGNLVEDHVERLEELASVLIETGTRDGEDSARLYGQRLKSGVRALTSVSASAPMRTEFKQTKKIG